MTTIHREGVMTTIHSTTIVGRCLLGCADVYTTEFVVDGSTVLPVERIAEAIAEATRDPIYQEDLTRRLAKSLGCVVVTRGRHGVFDTECRAGE